MYEVYAIVNRTNGRAYIGIAPSTDSRRQVHIRRLNEQWHSNAALQADWNALGESAFAFVVIGEATKQYRHSIEGAYIAAWKYDTYNVVKNKASMNVLPHPVEIDYSRVPEPS